MTREEAIKILKTERYCQEDTPMLKQVRKAYDMAIEALEADTVEVVRCKDCKWRKEDNSCDLNCRIEYLDGTESDLWFYVKDEDFCSYGERSEE